MKEKLREFAEAWSNAKGEETLFIMGMVAGMHACARQVFEILDTEGDGGAVGELVRTAPEQIYLQISDNQGDHEDAFPANYGDEITWCADSVLDCEVKYVRADLAHPHPARSGVVRDEDVFYIDCEFDGHNGPLLSLAIVAQDGRSIHVRTDAAATDPWVIENVMPLMDSHKATRAIQVPTNSVGTEIRRFLAGIIRPVIVADSPADIARFCNALSTSSRGQWESANYPRMTFRVENVDCYPTSLAGAVQHNAWWDAMALHAALTHFAKGERHE